jgi:hypothetical protein
MSKRNKNYFFVVTGLQVINCVEYIKNYQLDKGYNVLFVCNKKINSRLEVLSLIKNHYFDEVIFMPPTFLLNKKIARYNFVLINLISFFKIFLFKFNEGHLVGNDLNAFYRYACKKSKNVKISFIDDGSGSVNYKAENPFKYFKNYKNKLLYKFLRINNYDILFDQYFTSYGSFFLQKFKYKIVNNNFNYLKNISFSNINDYIIFIGDPHVERGYISEDNYLDILVKIRDMFQKEIIYVPRIFESTKKLKKIEQIMSVQRNDFPIEIYLSSLEKLPNRIITFHSSALFNVRNLFGENIDYHYIKLPNYTNEVHMKNLQKIWNDLASFSKEIVLCQK